MFAILLQCQAMFEVHGLDSICKREGRGALADDGRSWRRDGWKNGVVTNFAPARSGGGELFSLTPASQPERVEPN